LVAQFNDKQSKYLPLEIKRNFSIEPEST